jgi:uncharacterized protein YkwD
VGCSARNAEWLRVPAETGILLEMHNQQRDRPLQLDPVLMKYAQSHAEWMATNRLRHSDLNPLLKSYRGVGENIAAGQRNEAGVFRDWMNSSGHRANILNPIYTKVGFGVAVDNRGERYWCAVFAS